MHKRIPVIALAILALLASTLLTPPAPAEAVGSPALQATFSSPANGWSKVERWNDPDPNFVTETFPADGRGNQTGTQLTYFGGVTQPSSGSFLMYYAPSWKHEPQGRPGPARAGRDAERRPGVGEPQPERPWWMRLGRLPDHRPHAVTRRRRLQGVRCQLRAHLRRQLHAGADHRRRDRDHQDRAQRAEGRHRRLVEGCDRSADVRVEREEALGHGVPERRAQARAARRPEQGHGHAVPARHPEHRAPCGPNAAAR